MSELFSAFGIDWHLLLAQGVNFAIVLVALWYFLYKPVMTTLQMRREVVAKGVEDAQRAGEKLAGADAAAAMRVATADSEAQEIVARSRAAASAQMTSMLEEARTRAEAVGRDARERAAEEAARTLRESEREIARLAMLAAEKVLIQKA